MTLVGLALSSALVAAACSTSNEPATPAVAEAEETPKIVGAPEVGLINEKGGTKIAVLVNRQAITTNHIKRRAAFVRLRRMKGNATTIATNELIDEAVQNQEALRLGALATPAQINRAYASFAKSNRMTTAQLDRLLAQSGVTRRGFQSYIRATISWRTIVAARSRAQSNATGTSPSWLPAKGSQSGKATEYTIQQIVFIVPTAQRNALLSKRRAEAKRFRAQLNGCSNARQLAVGLKDVTVLDRGRLLESELPPRWAKQIKETPAGSVTRVQDDPKGVEMIAVCKTREVIGTGGGIDADILSGGGQRNAQSEVAKQYLAELKKRAVIQRR